MSSSSITAQTSILSTSTFTSIGTPNAMSAPNMPESYATLFSAYNLGDGVEPRVPSPLSSTYIYVDIPGTSAPQTGPTSSHDSSSTLNGAKKENTLPNMATAFIEWERHRRLRQSHGLLRRLLSASIFGNVALGCCDCKLWLDIPNLFHFLAAWFFLRGLHYYIWQRVGGRNLRRPTRSRDLLNLWVLVVATAVCLHLSIYWPSVNGDLCAWLVAKGWPCTNARPGSVCWETCRQGVCRR
ncbi:hypothetical protein IWX46DRAFT_611306 [Phyllosticta citricarpa]|uniref:Uncharacterized protein n=1 Tax=Phyllosticta citricarpa TaxID=55181 RepID=A0ABR1LK99_9PEZI